MAHEATPTGSFAPMSLPAAYGVNARVGPWRRRASQSKSDAWADETQTGCPDADSLSVYSIASAEARAGTRLGCFNSNKLQKEVT